MMASKASSPDTNAPKHSPLRYFVLKSNMTILRLLISAAMRLSSPPVPQHRPADERTTYHSITGPLAAHIYLPSGSSSSSSSPLTSSPLLPVHISIHGSGFTIPSFGADSYFCRRTADAAGCVVLDIDHRHGPEGHWPAPLEDVRSAVAWVDSVAAERGWDAQRLSIGGFSSGGALALVSASATAELSGRFGAVVAFYPSTNLGEPPEEKPKVKPGKGAAGGTIPPKIRRFFYACYLPKGVDRKDPRISALFADPADFPDSVTIVTCSGDSLQREARALADKLKAAGRDVVEFEAEDQGHSWDLMVKKEDSQPGKLRDEAYNLAAKRLKTFYGT